MQKFQIFLKSFSFLHNFSKFHHYSNQKQIMYVIIYKTYSSENVLQWFNPFWPFTWGCLCFNPQLTCPNLTGTPKITLDIKHKISQEIWTQKIKGNNHGKGCWNTEKQVTERWAQLQSPQKKQWGRRPVLLNQAVFGFPGLRQNSL